jgi:hypothetical protein
MGYKFTAELLKGANNEAADALSRHPYQQPADGDDQSMKLTPTTAKQPSTEHPIALIDLTTIGRSSDNMHQDYVRSP